MGAAPIFSLILLAPALLWAAVGDWRRRDIPNRLNAVIALTAPLYWWAAGFTMPEILTIAGLAFALFAIFTLAFFMNAMGGGDVKLIGALALWMTPAQLPVMLFVMAVAGGVLTLAMLVAHRVTKAPGRPEIPYGIAISIGGLWVVLNEILTLLLD